MLRRLIDARARRKRAVFFIATVGALLLAVTLSGCSLSKDQPPGAAIQPASGAGTGFTAHTTAGKPIKVPGAQPAVVLFFSVECGGCGPTANALASVQADDPAVASFVIVDVAAYETERDIRRFLDANDAGGLGYTRDADGRLTADYKVTQLSTVLILDAANKVAFRAIEPSAETIRSELAKVTGS